jgi:hypothetical protein
MAVAPNANIGLVAVLLVLYLPPVLHQLKVDTLLELFS